MAQISYEIRGTNRVRNQLRTAAAFHPNSTDPIIGKHARAEQKRLRAKPYPPERPGQRYKRKRYFGGIAGSFSARRMQAGTWQVINSRPYAGYVIGPSAGAIGTRQAWMHRGRWWQMPTELQQNMPQLTQALSKHLEQLMERG